MMKNRYMRVLFLVVMLFVLTSCGYGNIKINKLDKAVEKNGSLKDNQKEAKENIKKGIAEEKKEVEKIKEKNLETKEEVTRDNILEPTLKLSTDKIEEYFNMEYDDFGKCLTDKIFYYNSKEYTYLLEFPMISLEEDVTFCFANDYENLTPSYIRVSTKYEIEALADFGINNNMSLHDIIELDSALEIKEYWTGVSDRYKSYIELTIDDFVYILFAYNADDIILDISLKKIGANLLDVAYNDVCDIVSNYSDYTGVPIFYTRGNINNDSYEDIIITSEKGMDENDWMDERRVTLILFGGKDDYVKYGEVEGLITSNGGLLGAPFVSTSIDNGIISISQYGGSAWRWNTISTYKYDKTDEKIYLISEENSNYHNIRPIKDTLQTIFLKHDKGSDILECFTFRNNVELQVVTETINKSKITYRILGDAKNEEEKFVNETIRKYRNILIKNIEKENLEGEFEIIFYSMIKNDKVTSICIAATGHYYDCSEEVEDDKYNQYFYDEVYANINLFNLKELDILDYYTVDEIAQSLYDRHVEWGNIDEYSVKSKEDIVSVIENSLNNTAEYNNKFGYCFNDLSIKIVLYLQYKGSNIVHERDSVLLRTDELVEKPTYYLDWFESTLQ